MLKPDAMGTQVVSVAKATVKIPVAIFDRAVRKASEAFGTLKTYVAKSGEVRRAITRMEALPFVLVKTSEKEVNGEVVNEAMIRFSNGLVFRVILEWGGWKLFRKITVDGIEEVVPVQRAGIEPSAGDPEVGAFFVV